ncbi:MAG TPA: hypothetical protein VF498_19270 [Anaerolineales bacterium]
MPEYYQSKIKGQLDQRSVNWFADLELISLEGQERRATGASLV